MESLWNVKAFAKAQNKVREAERAMDAIIHSRCKIGTDIEWWHGNNIQRGEIVSPGGRNSVEVRNHKTGTVRWIPPYFIVSVGGKR